MFTEVLITSLITFLITSLIKSLVFRPEQMMVDKDTGEEMPVSITY